MRIQFASDLHLEFKENRRYLMNNPLIPVGDVLVLAGDAACMGDEYLKLSFWDWASDNFQRVIVIPGNHEFYRGYDLGSLKKGESISIRKNVSWHYNQSVVIDDVLFILTTLWSVIPSHLKLKIEERISDFQCIKYNEEPFSIDLYNKEHQACIDFLRKELTTRVSKKVIVSHHIPTELCIDENLKNSWYKSVYVSESKDIIRQNNISYWIYGHSHQNIPLIELDKTKLVCNQLGYVYRKEYKTFKRDLCFYL